VNQPQSISTHKCGPFANCWCVYACVCLCTCM